MNSQTLRVASWLDDLAVTVGTTDPDGEAAAAAVVSPDFIEGIRGYLNARAEEATARLDPSLVPLRLPKSRLEDLGNCERMALARAAPPVEPEPITEAMFRGTALDRFVIHQLTVGRVLDPLETLRSMFAAEGEAELAHHLELLDEADETRLSAMLGPLATAVAEGWSGIGAEWFPRTQSSATAVFGGGEGGGAGRVGVVCSGRIDVEVGGVLTGLPGVLVEVKSGSARREHEAELYFYALLVALRDGRAPRGLLRWYPGSAPVITPVFEGLLESVAVRLADSIGSWAALIDGSQEPTETPGSWCNWCPDSDQCPSSSAKQS